MNCYSRDGILNVVISGAPTFLFSFFLISISPIFLKSCITKLILHNRLLSGLGA